jgi:hypothetical protein
MNSNTTGRRLEDMKIPVKMKLSALWVVLMAFYIYADFFSLFQPGEIENMIAGRMGPYPVTPGGLFTATILMVIPAVMIFFSLILKAAVNRWTNIIVGGLYLVVSIQNIIGETWAYYIFYGIIEALLLSLMIWYAWTWPTQEA